MDKIEKHSVHGEEDIIMKYLPNIKQGKFVDIGCAGRSSSNTFYFHDKGWKGLFIDAHPRWKNRQENLLPGNIFLNIAISDYNGKLEMCASVTSESWLGRKYKYEEGRSKQTYMVDCMTMDTLIEKNPFFKEVDFIDIDIDSGEDKLLAKCNFNIFKPKLILIEYLVRRIDMRSKWEYYLLPYYEFKEILGGNAFYLRKEQ